MTNVQTRYIVTFDPAGVSQWDRKGPNSTPQVIYRGDDETIMYSHVSAVEAVLMATYQSGEIEIIDNGQPRYIEYRQGGRTDI